MFDINDLLGCFPLAEEKKALKEAYNLASRKNKNKADGFFDAVYYLKIANPTLQIAYNSKLPSSYYSTTDNTIYLKNFYELIHEFTHLLSYNYKRGIVPVEYYMFKNSFFSNNHNTSLMVELVKSCQDVELNELAQQIMRKKEKFDLVEYLSGNSYEKVEDLTVYRVEDIIDAIYGGRALNEGIYYISNTNQIVEKAPQISSGHGKKYYQNSECRQFEEILANYMDIMLTDPDNELFLKLKGILGSEFVTFLNNRCNEICFNLLNYNMDISNIISK